MRLGARLACVAIAVATPGCSETSPPEPVDLAGRWALTSATFEGTTYRVTPTTQQHSPTLVLDRAGVGQAISGCDVAEVRAKTVGRDVTITVREAYSMLSCPPGSSDVLDGHYEEALLAVQDATRSEDELLLAGSATRLTYEPLVAQR